MCLSNCISILVLFFVLWVRIFASLQSPRMFSFLSYKEQYFLSEGGLVEETPRNHHSPPFYMLMFVSPDLSEVTVERWWLTEDRRACRRGAIRVNHSLCSLERRWLTGERLWGNLWWVATEIRPGLLTLSLPWEALMKIHFLFQRAVKCCCSWHSRPHS